MEKFDIAINTVGKVLKKPISDITETEYDDMFAINSKVAFFFIKHAEKHLVDGGCIISLVTSLLGAFAPGYAAYQGSKSPVEWFTKSAAKEQAFATQTVTADDPDTNPVASASTVLLRGQWVSVCGRERTDLQTRHFSILKKRPRLSPSTRARGSAVA